MRRGHHANSVRTLSEALSPLQSGWSGAQPDGQCVCLC